MTMEQMNRISPRRKFATRTKGSMLSTPPKKSVISDFDVQINDEANDRKSVLRKSVIRVKKHDRSSYLEKEMEMEAKLDI